MAHYRHSLIEPSVTLLYIDPGAGSMVIQAVLAAALAIPFFFRTHVDVPSSGSATPRAKQGRDASATDAGGSSASGPISDDVAPLPWHPLCSRPRSSSGLAGRRREPVRGVPAARSLPSGCRARSPRSRPRHPVLSARLDRERHRGAPWSKQLIAS